MSKSFENNQLNFNTKYLVYFVLAIYPLIGMGIDLIAPSLPAISVDLHAHHWISKNLISVYLAGNVIGNLFIGFLTDSWGRKKVISSSLLIFAIASLFPIFKISSFTLLLSRFLQGLVVSGFGAASRAMLADVLPPERLARVGAAIASMWAIGPIVGPIIGSYLQHYFHWQAEFYFFSLYAFLGFIYILQLPETLVVQPSNSLRQSFLNFKTVLTHPGFLALCMLMSFGYSLLIVFNIMGPFLIQNELHYSTLFFGHTAFSLGIIFLFATVVARWLFAYFQLKSILTGCTVLFLVIETVLLILSYQAPYRISLIIFSTLCMYITCGVNYPTCLALNMVQTRKMPGIGSSAMSFINVALTTLLAFLISLISHISGFTLNLIYFSFMVISTVAYLWFLRSPEEL